jgi:hypothetical protein
VTVDVAPGESVTIGLGVDVGDIHYKAEELDGVDNPDSVARLYRAGQAWLQGSNGEALIGARGRTTQE